MAEKIYCEICPRHCGLEAGQTGFCKARKNTGDRIEPVNYGRCTSASLDPIEKKPLARFYPGSRILSVGSFGCNLVCPFCQNYQISMAGDDMRTAMMPPELLAEKAAEYADRLPDPQGGDGHYSNLGVAFTYNEPLVGYEYVRDTAKLVHERGLLNVVVTNGLISREPLSELLPLIDAMNIDLKGIHSDYYDWVSGGLTGALDVVMDNIRIAHEAGCHVEITTLIVPGKNDSLEDMSVEAEWLASLSPDIPLHISRFFPRYNFTEAEPTSVKRIYELCDIAARFLRHVYPGNC